MVLPAEGQVTVPLAAAAVLVGMAETEGISNERAKVDTTTGTQNGPDTRPTVCNLIAPQQGMCKWVV